MNAPKAGSTMRSPSAAKHLRLTERPRAEMRAIGCRCPAISPLPALRLMPEGQRPDRDRRREHAADAGRGIGIVIAGDPDPVAALLQRAIASRSCGAQPLRAVAIMEAVAERKYRARPVAHDRLAKPRQRRRRVDRAAAARHSARSSRPFRNADRRPRAAARPANRGRPPDRPRARRRQVPISSVR